MSVSVMINAHMYNLLIKKELNHFSVTQLRDELMYEYQEFKDSNEARKFVYRQILRFVDKGFIEKSSNASGKTVYRKTKTFFQTTFKPRLSRKKNAIAEAENTQSPKKASFIVVLKSELARYEAELSITLREMEKYQSLMSSFPEQAEFISPFFADARARAKDIQGDMEAVNNLVMHYPGDSSC